MKTFAYIVSALLTLLILVVVITPFFLDLNDYKGDIATAVKDATGRDLAIDGDIAVSLLPVPTIKVAGVRFANLEGATAPDMVRIGVVEASVALMPLFSGTIEVGSLAFIEPVVELEILADGRANWQLAMAGTGSGSDGPALSIDRLTVKGATLVYRDGIAGTVERLENLNLEAAVDSINGPFRAKGSVVARSIPLTFEARIGDLGRRPVPLRVDLTLNNGATTVAFNGAASSVSPDAELSGKIKIAGTSLADLIGALSGAAANPLLAQEFLLNGSVAASIVTAAINDIVFDIGGMQGTGAVNALLVGEPHVDVAVALNHVDLDQLLATATAAAPARDDGGGFTLPGGIYATLDLRINAVVYNQAVVRQAQLVAALDQGVVTLQQASALLPGGSDVTIFGVLDAHDGRHRFNGQVEASADNLRAVFDWLDVTPVGVPADRLRKLSLSTTVEITPSLVKVSAIDLRVDSSRLTGAANIGLGPRPAFNAIVALDQINLDAYLPVPSGDQESADGDSPLALLGGFDAELKATVGKLVYNGLPLSDVTLDAGLRRGVLSIRSLRVADLAGAGASLAGTIDSTTPAFDVTYSVDAADAARLFQLADVAPPGGNLGGVVIRGAAKGDLAAVTLDTTVSLSDAEARFTGTLDGLAGTPRVDAEISLHADSLALLARRFGTTLSDTAHTAFDVSGTVKGDAAAATVALTVEALGADLRLDGSLANLLDAPTYDLVLNLNHGDFVAFAESLGDDIRFARRDRGKVQVTARISGDATQARIADIRAVLGPSQLAGVVALRFDGPKPSFDADIAAGEIHTDLFHMVAKTAAGDTAGAATTTSGGSGTTATGRWSRQPIDFSGLSAVDGKALVSAKALIFRKYRFEAVTLQLALAGGALDIEDLSGRLYGAPVKLRARITDTAPPTAALALTLQGADLEALLNDVADVDAASGKLDLTAQFQTRGRSELELISALGGKGTIAVRQGVVKGIDLGRLNAQLANIDNEIALVGLIGGALSGGVTPIHSLDGTFNASNGVIKSNDIRAVLDGGEGTALATVDLPRWQLAMNSEFRLTGHPKAPPVGLLLMGPIDNPSREIRDQALKAHITEKVFSTVARKVLVPAITGEGGLVGGLLGAVIGTGQAQDEPAEGDKIPP
ncbi:MAG: AsmA family protein, partial [Alphaproteobacteria bacterium]